ncbi:patatin-like phospholipase family protein [Desulfoferrobacter suflitae]|uniref:patatin-like phospholipase family protein n=1 Tax=Desulfoferrobacter suflitae TaxID=2865782 RepID=UPI0021647E47|nr:patatin-like phospholipase family protein [Desulfoferrobacter suflitae]MCK8600107.1 patatin-like phospholipase family protein [Desulfoferrobacter suflitae]
MRKYYKFWRVFLASTLILFTGCAHYIVNEQSREFDSESGYRFDAIDPGPHNSDSLFVCLMFSGGGTRAAALSYGIMEALRDTVIVVDGQEKRLLDEVDCISSVSGGSFTAAYYGLFRDRLFEDFRVRFLERDIQGSLAGRLFNPVNWIRLASPYFSRIDMAAEFYNSDIFDAATFESLQGEERPFVILNATNLGANRRFDFTQEYFDALGSRLDLYQVSRAVAASSAFPYLLTPISLKNYPVAEGYTPPWWYEKALTTEDWITERYNAAKNLKVYLDKENRYIHLMDGGLSDNIGARGILDALDRGFIRTRINQGAIEHLVLIVVNARTQSEDQISRKEKPPGFFTVAEKTATVAMDNYSYDSVTELREALYRRVQTQKNDQACVALLSEYCPEAPKPILFPVDIDPYVIEINFEAADQIPGEDPRYYLDLPTSFKLSKEQVAKLIAIGPKLLQTSPQYQCLLEVLAAKEEGRPRPEACPIGAGIFP